MLLLKTITIIDLSSCVFVSQVRPVSAHRALVPSQTAARAGVEAVTPLGSGPKRFLSYQENLPSLPVPPLQQTLDRFLSSAAPLLSDDELKHAEKVKFRMKYRMKMP